MFNINCSLKLFKETIKYEKDIDNIFINLCRYSYLRKIKYLVNMMFKDEQGRTGFYWLCNNNKVFNKTLSRD